MIEVKKKDMNVDLENNTIDIPSLGVIDIQLIIDAYERIEQAKGIAAAKEKGIYKKPFMLPNNFYEYYERIEAGSISVVDAIKYMGISRATYYRLKDKHEKGLI